MKIDFLKLYGFLIEDNNIDLEEAVLLSSYINKYIMYKGNVIISDTEDGKTIKKHRNTAAAKRIHLEELGYIKYSKTGKGNTKKILINEEILNNLELPIYK